VDRKRVQIVGAALIVISVLGAFYWHREDAFGSVKCDTSVGSKLKGSSHHQCEKEISAPITPRTMKDSQKTAILAALSKAPPAIALFLVPESIESREYLQQLENIVIHDAHWTSLHLPSQDHPSRSKLTIGWQVEKTESYLALAKGLSDAQVDFQEKQFEGTDAAIIIDAGVLPIVCSPMLSAS
jgi:hypothetical protein